MPRLLLEHLRPGVEPGAVPPCVLDHRRRRLPTARQRALEHRGAHVVHGQPDLAGRHRTPHVRLLRLELVTARHALPLERRVWLGDEVRDADVHAEAPAASLDLTTDLPRPNTEVDDALHL